MATRLYFHAATGALSNLPTTEQASYTADAGKNADAFTVNRTMDTTIGTGQTSLAISIPSTTALQTYYYTRFVSQQLLGVGSISANTWTWNFAAQTSSTTPRFPFSNAGNCPVVIYVWRPSTQTKVGTIFDAASPTITRSLDTTEKSVQTTVSGAAVSSIQDGDVIIAELWIQWTPSASGAATGTIYFDGVTVTVNNTTVTDHASYAETPQTLTFGAPAGPVTCTPTGKTIYNKTMKHG